MISGLLVRAPALGPLAVASFLSCSSHVDVGFASDGGAQAMSAADTGDSAGLRGAMDGDSGPPCIMITSCENGRTVRTTLFAFDWCADACRQSTPDCDAEGVDLSKDPNNCGRCGYKCASVETCMSGDCIR